MMNKNRRKLITFVILLALLGCGFIYYLTRYSPQYFIYHGWLDEKWEWAQRETLSRYFDGRLIGDTVYLDRYVGEQENVWIADEYRVNGKVYKVGDHLGPLFKGTEVRSAILPEGVVTLNRSIFSTRTLAYIYIPASVQVDSDDNAFYTGFQKVKKLYYGGTREQWHDLMGSTNRDEIGVEKIFYEATQEDARQMNDEVLEVDDIADYQETEGHRWADKPLPISSFGYYLDGDKVYLKSGRVRGKRVWIASEYTINGKTYTVGEMISADVSFPEAESIILPEGIRYVHRNVISNQNLRYIYLPSTLKVKEDDKFPFYEGFFYPVIYYQGTEEQWATLTNNASRRTVLAKQIIYEADLDQLLEEDKNRY